ncbi:hypothetical protein [Acinetobacter sp.]|uniref:hypothetical protein n=1 Tax=Acinetobacter sp. TaxID=472 RepID=UPI003890BB29
MFKAIKHFFENLSKKFKEVEQKIEDRAEKAKDKVEDKRPLEDAHKVEESAVPVTAKKPRKKKSSTGTKPITKRSLKK